MIQWSRHEFTSPFAIPSNGRIDEPSAMAHGWRLPQYHIYPPGVYWWIVDQFAITVQPAITASVQLPMTQAQYNRL